MYKKTVRLGMFHSSVNHSNKEYVRGLVHTNTIEGFWGQMKRSIDGTYHAISPKYLQSYVDEFAWRYNERFSSSPAFLTILSLACGLPYSGENRSLSFEVPVA